MRRLGLAVLAFLFSSFTILGAEGMMLCLHKAGPRHLETAPTELAARQESTCLDCSCDQAQTHECAWCMDLELKGLDLAQLRFENVELAVAAPAEVAVIPPQEWTPPRSADFQLSPARTPPAKAEALLVAELVVLLL